MYNCLRVSSSFKPAKSSSGMVATNDAILVFAEKLWQTEICAHIRNMPRKSGMPPVRSEKLALADSRALEEQAEREADTKGMPQKPLPLAGAGKKILSGMTRKAAAAEEPSEAEGYGRQLMEHIHKLHGGAYGTAFMKGMSAYGNPGVSGVPVAFSSNVPEKAADAPKALKGKGRMIGAGKLKIEHEGEMEGCGTKKGQVRKTARKAFEGMGKLTIEHGGEESECEEEMEGGLLTGRYEGEGRHEEAPKVNHRSARAAIVKKVMKEKGMKMAEASKYVKEHGLYKRD